MDDSKKVDYTPFESSAKGPNISIEYSPFVSNIQSPLPTDICNCCGGVNNTENIYSKVDKLIKENENLKGELDKLKNEYLGSSGSIQKQLDSLLINHNNLTKIVYRNREAVNNVVKFYVRKDRITLRSGTLVNNVIGTDTIEKHTGKKVTNQNCVVFCCNDDRTILENRIYALNYYPQSTSYGYWTLKMDEAPSTTISALFTFFIVIFEE